MGIFKHPGATLDKPTERKTDSDSRVPAPRQREHVHDVAEGLPTKAEAGNAKGDEPPAERSPRRANESDETMTEQQVLDDTTSAAAHADPMVADERTKLTVALPSSVNSLLSRLAKDSGYNKTTTLVRAVRLLGTVEDALRDGGRVTVTHADGVRERLTLL